MHGTAKEWENIKNFKAKEFEDKKYPSEGPGWQMDIELVKILDLMRERCGFAFPINSAFRTIKHNMEIDGVENSAHTRGHAVDIAVYDSNRRYKIIEALFLVEIENAIKSLVKDETLKETLLNVIKSRTIKRFHIDENFIHLDNDNSLPQEVCWATWKGIKNK